MLIKRRLNIDATSRRCVDVEATLFKRHSKEHHDIASTLTRSCINVLCILGNDSIQLKPFHGSTIISEVILGNPGVMKWMKCNVMGHTWVTEDDQKWAFRNFHKF